MRILMFSFIFLFSVRCAVLNAQITDTVEWAPVGTTWLYRELSAWVLSFNHFEVTADTIINQKTCKIIKVRERNFYFDNPNTQLPAFLSDNQKENLILCKSQDSVFWYKPIVNGTDTTLSLELLFVFDLPPGGMYEIQPNPTDFLCDPVSQPEMMLVTDTGTITRAGRTFHYQDFNQQQLWTVGNRIVKNIGSLNTFLVQPTGADCEVIDGMIGISEALVCYYDPIRGYILWSSYNEDDCLMYLYTQNSISEQAVTQKYVYPNPAEDFLFISGSHTLINTDYVIYDFQGRKMVAGRFVESGINLGNLKSGMYLLELQSMDAEKFLLKFLKK